jgi:hypothetical protein
MSPCPHCHALAEVERSTAVRWRCGVCGGPVVPGDGSFPRDDRELASLVAAARARGMAIGWAAGGVVLLATGVIALPVVLLLWSIPIAHVAALAVASVAAAALALAGLSAARYRARAAEARAKLEEAWRSVADELLRARGVDVTAPDLARALRTDEAHAEALLSGLSSEGHARVAVDDDAQLSYRFAPEAEAEAGAGEASPPGAARRSP